MREVERNAKRKSSRVVSYVNDVKRVIKRKSNCNYLAIVFHVNVNKTILSLIMYRKKTSN